MRKYPFLLTLLGLLCLTRLYAEDYRWIITYPNASNDWGKRVACGENKLVLKAQFIALTPRNDYTLVTFAVRPTTTYLSRWLVKSMQLWLNTDRYPGSIDPATDSLVSQIDTLTILPQVTPSQRLTFTLPPGGVHLTDTTTFFVTMLFRDLHDTIPDNREITDQDGAHFGLTISRQDGDLMVPPSQLTANNWSSSTAQLYTLRAKNLPIVLYNYYKSAEEDSFRFYPHWSALNNSPASKNQRLTDLTFPVYVNLPHSNLISGIDTDLLTYASFKLSWDNTILQLDSMAFGDIWDGKQYDKEGSGFGAVTIDPANAHYSTIRFEGVVFDASNAVEIDYNNLAVFYFKVIKPGISPLWLSEVTLLDQWGIRYHTYRTLHNNRQVGSRYDAWAKFNLGDFAGTHTLLTSGYGNGLVDPMTDVALFSNYLWLGKDSTNWYNRFDVGSASSHDPDDLSPDDTTNFYDLMIIGANYYRSYRGEFNQKAVAATQGTAMLSLQGPNSPTDAEYCSFVLQAQNLTALSAAHLLLNFAPDQWQLEKVMPGDWLENAAPHHFLTIAPHGQVKGVLDINLLTFTRPLTGSGNILRFVFRRLTPEATPIQLVSADLRNPACRSIPAMLQIAESRPLPIGQALLTCFPNPFNPYTHIRYTIPVGREGPYRLSIYDLNGQLIRVCRQDYHQAGYYEFDWDGKNELGQIVGSGLYILQLSGRGERHQQKITLIR